MTTLLRRLSALASGFPALKQLIPAAVRRAIYVRLLEREIPFYPDRVHMRDVILPILSTYPGANILNVGCRRYSVGINLQLRAAGKTVSTIDIDPSAARWGTERHVVGDATCLEAYFEQGIFDVVIFNGIFGFGIDDGDQIDRALIGLSLVLKPGGILVLGWNLDRITDLMSHVSSSLFRPHADFEQIDFEDFFHTYRVLERC